MNQMDVQLSVTYDDTGNVIAYKLQGMGVTQSIDIRTLDTQAVACNAEAVVLSRVCAALNNEFNLPAIPGMER